MGDPLTSLEGGARVGSGLGKGYKSPPPSALLHQGPREARSAPGGLSSRLLPGGGGGGSERAPGMERSGQRAPDGEDSPGKRCLPAGASESDSRVELQERRRTSAAGSAGTGRAGRVALTMVSCWDTGVLLCALLGCLLLPGEAGLRRGCGARGLRGPGPGARGEGRLQPGKASFGGHPGRSSSQRARQGPRHPFSVCAPRSGCPGPAGTATQPGRGAAPGSEPGSEAPCLVAAAVAVPCQAPGRGLPTEAPGTRATAHADLPGTQSLLPGGLERDRRALRSRGRRLLDAREAAGAWAILGSATGPAPRGEGGGPFRGSLACRS